MKNKINSGLLRNNAFGIAAVVEAWNRDEISEERMREEVLQNLSRINFLLDHLETPGYDGELRT